MRKLSRREKELVALVLVAVLIHFGWGRGVRPVLTHWRDLRSEATSLDVELLQHQASLRQKQRVEQQYRSIGAVIRQRGTNEEQIARLLQTVTGAMKKQGVTDKGVRVYPVEDGGFYRRYRFRLEIEGGVAPVAGLLDSLVRARENFRVEEMTLRASGRYEVLRAVLLISSIAAVEAETPSEGRG